MTRWRLLAAAATLAVLGVAACAEDAPTGDASPARGEEVYARHCASCHGDDLRGTNVGPSLLSIVYEPGHHPDETFRIAIRQGSPQHHWGFGPMPAIDGVAGNDVDAVIAFVRVEQDRHGFEPYPPNE